MKRPAFSGDRDFQREILRLFPSRTNQFAKWQSVPQQEKKYTVFEVKTARSAAANG